MSTLGSPASLPHTLVIHHSQDSCKFTLPAGVEPFIKWSAGRARVSWVSGGKEEGDLGFPSGHAAVSAALTAAMWPDATPGWRVACGALSAFVAFARMYVGAHLPLDVIGGAGLGVAVARVARTLTADVGGGQSESP